VAEKHVKKEKSWREMKTNAERLLRLAGLFHRRLRYEQQWRRQGVEQRQQVSWTRLQQQFAGLNERAFKTRFCKLARNINRRTQSASALWRQASIIIEAQPPS